MHRGNGSRRGALLADRRHYRSVGAGCPTPWRARRRTTSSSSHSLKSQTACSLRPSTGGYIRTHTPPSTTDNIPLRRDPAQWSACGIACDNHQALFPICHGDISPPRPRRDRLRLLRRAVLCHPASSAFARTRCRARARVRAAPGPGWAQDGARNGAFPIAPILPILADLRCAHVSERRDDGAA